MKVWAASKFGLLLGVFLILTGLTFWDSGLKDIYGRGGGARICFYLTADEKLPLTAFSGDIFIIKNGGGVIVDAPPAAARELRRGFSGIKGESVSFDGGYGDALEILKLYRVKIIFEETVPDAQCTIDNAQCTMHNAQFGDTIKIIYGFSRLFTRSVNLDGKKVNIQIAVNGSTGRVTVGTPLILGSY